MRRNDVGATMNTLDVVDRNTSSTITLLLFLLIKTKIDVVLGWQYQALKCGACTL